MILAAKGDRADGAFDRVVVEFDTPIIEESGEGWPARECITNGLGQATSRWNATKLHLEPRLHHLDQQPGAGDTNMPTRVCGVALDRSLDRIEFGDPSQGVCTENLSSDIVVVKSAEDRA